MPDPTGVAATHDVVQILFYFVCTMASVMAGSIVWFAKYMLIPARDRHFAFMDSLEISHKEVALAMIHIKLDLAAMHLKLQEAETEKSQA